MRPISRSPVKLRGAQAPQQVVGRPGTGSSVQVTRQALEDAYETISRERQTDLQAPTQRSVWGTVLEEDGSRSVPKLHLSLPAMALATGTTDDHHLGLSFVQALAGIGLNEGFTLELLGD